MQKSLTQTEYDGESPTLPRSELSRTLDSLKIVLIHDWLVTMRGGERVLEVICERFPQAPVSTLLYVPGTVSETIANREIKTSWLQHLPLARTKYRHYLPLFPLFAELSRVRDCDVVISSSHAVAKGMVKKDRNSRPLHICYIHTPMRYIWDRFDDYFGPDKVGSFASRFFFRPVAYGLQTYDRRTVDRVDVFVANSRFVADRVRRLYGRDAEVLPPPVDVHRFASARRVPEDWYLVVSALAPYKRVDHAVRACAALGRKLKIVGSGPEENKLRAIASETRAEVEFIGFVDNDELMEYYSHARGLLFPGVEDFGMVPVEAIASGCPVVAYQSGGILDSMTEDTAEFYRSETVEGLRDAMINFERRTFSDEALRRRAADFTSESFLDRFEQILGRALSEWRARAAV